MGHTYSPSIQIDLSNKFGLVVGPNASNPGVVGAYNPSASTMTQYCTALNNIVNAPYGTADGNLNVKWLIDSSETALI